MHYAVAEELADRVGILHRGKLAALGTLKEVTEQKTLNGGTLKLEDLFLELTNS